MNALGLPIFGDLIYPQLESYIKPVDRDYSSPLQLLAHKLTFKDPITSVSHEFTSSLRLDWPC
jgi:tRNA pseudouridine32 synthase/23S rRNA pseudouridine746 synthase